jgi:hypothetical protein
MLNRNAAARAPCRYGAVALLLTAPGMHAQQPAQSLRPLGRAELCVTEGALEPAADESLTVASPKMRAVARAPGAEAAEMRFTYLGPTAVQTALGSGALRQQWGLKLHALDACNLVYVMWRLTPEPRLLVQTKSNPGQQLSGECTNHGYRTIKPRLSAALPALSPGQSHALSAQIAAGGLLAAVDGRTVWQGELGPGAGASGRIGVRSDNVRLRFVLAAAPERAPAAAQPPACRGDSGQ